MVNRYLIFAIILIFIVVSSYIINFYFKLNYVFSNDTGAWGELGDYIGGLLNPLFSFMSLIFLIKSLNLQNQANSELRTQIKNSAKTEKLRAFESRLFNLIDAQKESFLSLKIKLKINKKNVIKQSTDAVICLETEVEKMKKGNKTDQEICDFLEGADTRDQIYSAARTFYIMVKMISDSLKDSEGYDTDDRKFYFLTLINFTDFSLLRLILITTQFTDYHSAKYLKQNQEFEAVLKSTGMNFNLYSST